MVIVGAGPVGSTLALLLARYNIKSVVVEKQNKQDLVSHPRAHVVNSRTLEIIRGVSDPRDQLIERVMSSVHKMSTWDKFIYASSICGTHLGTTHHFPVGKDERQRVLQQWRDLISPYHVVNLPQSTLQGLLLDEMAKYPELIELHTETEFCKYNYLENSKGLQVHFNRVDGSGDGMRIDCSFVVGCDGASSKVRREAGLRLQGDPEKQHFLNIEFKVCVEKVHPSVVELCSRGKRGVGCGVGGGTDVYSFTLFFHTTCAVHSFSHLFCRSQISRDCCQMRSPP